MPKKILKFGLLIFIQIAIIGGAFFLTAKEAQAQSAIRNLEVEVGDNFIEAITRYALDFDLGNLPLLPGGNIHIEFPGGYKILNNTQATSSSEQLTCNVQKGNLTIICSNSSLTDTPIPEGSHITIIVSEIQNPDTPGDTYPIRVSALGPSGARGAADIEYIKIVGGEAEDEKRQQEGTSIFPPFGSCSFKVYDCLISLGLYIPKVAANLLIGTISSIIGLLVAFLVGLASGLVEVAADLSNTFDTPESAARIGFNVSLGIANIGFVLAIIFIAFATILRRSEGYTIKRALPRLIIIAILINFSWYFAITIIEISNTVANGLMSAVGKIAPDPQEISVGDFKKLGAIFTNAFQSPNMDTLLPANIAFLFPGLEFLTDIFRGLMKVIMQAIFGLLAFFALISTSVMLVIRHIAMTLLLALLPLALVMNIFPNLQVSGTLHPWKWWTGEFTKWILFYPIVMFFLALGFVTGQELLGTVSLNPFQNAINMLVVAGIMIGGLLIAKKMGITGANFANAVASKTVRRLPANIAALRPKNIRDRFSKSREGARETSPEAPRSRLQFRETPRGVPTPESLGTRPGEAQEQLVPWPEESRAPLTFAEHPETQAEIERLNREEAPPTPETPTKEKPKPGWAKKGLDKALKWSSGGPGALEIFGAGVKEIIGEEGSIFKGLYTGGGDEFSKAKESLDKLKEKYEDIDKELFNVIEKLDDHESGKKLLKADALKFHQAKKERLINNRDERYEKVEGALKKTSKKVKRLGGKTENIDQFIKDKKTPLTNV